MKELELARIAELVEGDLRGNPQQIAQGLCALDEPSPHCVTFTNVTDRNHLERELTDLQVAAILVKSSADLPETNHNVISVKNPLLGMIHLAAEFYPRPAQPATLSPQAVVDETAKIGKDVSIAAFCVIGAGVTIEDGVVLHPHVVLYPGAQVGAHSVLHSGVTVREECKVGPHSVIQNGAIIGSDGFGYIPDADGRLLPVPQVGTVNLSEAVDVGANTCIDRAAFGSTALAAGTKVDNLVQIGHNTKVGENSLLCGQVGIAGSVRLGKGVTLGGMVGVADHITIGDGIRVGAKGGVTHHLKEAGDYLGFPAAPAGKWRRQIVLLKSLEKRLKKIELALRDSRGSDPEESV